MNENQNANLQDKPETTFSSQSCQSSEVSHHWRTQFEDSASPTNLVEGTLTASPLLFSGIAGVLNLWISRKSFCIAQMAGRTCKSEPQSNPCQSCSSPRFLALLAKGRHPDTFPAAGANDQEDAVGIMQGARTEMEVEERDTKQYLDEPEHANSPSVEGILSAFPDVSLRLN